MTDQDFYGIEIKPASGDMLQLFMLLHGVGSSAANLLPLAHRFSAVFPHAVILLPEGIQPADSGNGRQWYSNRNMSDESRVERVAQALPSVHQMLKQAQHRYGIDPAASALGGFSQGAILALEFSARHDGEVGRVLAFAGRYARLPERAPQQTTIHLLHGGLDTRIPLQHAQEAAARLDELDGDVTLDVVDEAGHEINAALADQAIHRLQTCIPKRLWQQAMQTL